MENYLPFECKNCGIQLPLKAVTPHERPQVWVCSNCGCRQLAMFDRDARPVVQANAHRLDIARPTVPFLRLVHPEVLLPIARRS